LEFSMPNLAVDPIASGASYRVLDSGSDVDVLSVPGVVQVDLPSADQIGTWEGLDPLEAGVDDLPPTLDDTDLAARLITWVRVRAEVPTADPTLPPGTTPAVNTLTRVFTIDPESGVVRFGDGTHGARPPLDAVVRADYDFGVGAAGNVGPASIDSGPALPAG